MKLLTFDQAITRSDKMEGGRTALLGNGFSIDWDPKTFRYESLFEEASFKRLSVDKRNLFDKLETRDFEHVISSLNSSADLLDLYESSGKLADRMRIDADLTRTALADVIAARHPHNSNELTDAQCTMARAFLSNFGRIFTLSYDLLLYWVVNRNVGDHPVVKGDGFEWPTSAGGELIWKRTAAERGQQIFYLHGGLHLFQDDDYLVKLQYRSGSPIVSQIRGELNQDRYPLLVTEGATSEKRKRIQANAYLRYNYRRLTELGGSLFIHGLALSTNDQHILDAIGSANSQVEAIFVSLHGDPTSEINEVIQNRARSMRVARIRNKGRALAVHFYDSTSAQIWR